MRGRKEKQQQQEEDLSQPSPIVYTYLEDFSPLVALRESRRTFTPPLFTLPSTLYLFIFVTIERESPPQSRMRSKTGAVGWVARAPGIQQTSS